MDSPRVIYESEEFLAVYKPAGLLVHPVKPESKAEPTLTDWLVGKFPAISIVGDDPSWRPGIVHRLDKTTSGVMVIPRTQEYFNYLKNLFQKGGIQKTYLAIVFGKPKNKKGVIEEPIGIGTGTLKRSVHSKRMIKSAKTEYEILETREIDGETFSILRVIPKTGRTHQIRVHLAFLGNPVVGDVLYGKKKQPMWAKRIMLHAKSLEWTSEDGHRIKVESETPPEFLAYFIHI